jgi:hypothetical protein
VLQRSVETGNYTSFRFSTRLSDNGILASMGSTGDSYNNALMENFWSTLKTELVYRTSLRTRQEAETRRSHTSTAGTTPAASRPAWATAAPTSTSPHGTPLTSISRTRPAPPWSQRRQITSAPRKAGVAQGRLWVVGACGQCFDD